MNALEGGRTAALFDLLEEEGKIRNPRLGVRRRTPVSKRWGLV